MANSFNLTARLNLELGRGFKPVIDRLRREIQSVKGNLDFKIDPATNQSVKDLNVSLASLETRLSRINSLSASIRSNIRGLGSSFDKAASATQKQAKSQAATNTVMAKTARGAAEAAGEIEEFGRVSGLAIRRFAGFTIATGIIFGFINAVQQATSEAISFERELIKISQVSNTSVGGLKGLTDEITRLSTTLGVSSSELLTASRTLKQAGFSATETKQALSALADTDLAPTFENLTTTTEGAIAVLRQFGLEATDLRSVLGSINEVSAQFAVESGDIIAAIRRAGGVFAAAAGDNTDARQNVREFIALFTSVRATTRETAESIAVGLRTIFSRLQRGTTIESLRELGIELTDLEGQFIGSYRAIEELSKGLSRLESTDPQFAAIVEELGGIRQIGKIIPVIQQVETRRKALDAAFQGSDQDSLAKNREEALKALQTQINRTRQRFLAFIRDVTQTDTFRNIASGALFMANAFITVADALKPLIPLIAAVGAIKGVGVVRQFASGFKKGAGGQASPITAGEKVGGLLGKSPNNTAQVTATTQNTAAITQNTNSQLQEANVQKASVNAQSSLVTALAGNASAVKLNTAAIGRLAGLLSSRSVSFALSPRTKRNAGGPIRRFARGGIVPGSSNSDTIDAKLTPGEAVIPKKSVSDLGGNTVNKLIRGDTSDVKLKDTASNNIVKASQIEQEVQQFNRGSVRGTIQQGAFKPELKSRGKAPGNVGRKKQFLQQRVEYLSARLEDGSITEKEALELRSLKQKLKVTQQSRTRRFSEQFLKFALGGIAAFKFTRSSSKVKNAIVNEGLEQKIQPSDEALVSVNPKVINAGSIINRANTDASARLLIQASEKSTGPGARGTLFEKVGASIVGKSLNTSSPNAPLDIPRGDFKFKNTSEVTNEEIAGKAVRDALGVDGGFKTSRSALNQFTRQPNEKKGIPGITVYLPGVSNRPSKELFNKKLTEYKQRQKLEDGGVVEIRNALRKSLESQLALTASSTGRISTTQKRKGKEEELGFLLEKSPKELTGDAATTRQRSIEQIGSAPRAGKRVDGGGVEEVSFGAAFLRPSDFQSSLDGIVNTKGFGQVAFGLEAGSLKSGISENIEDTILEGTINAIKSGAAKLSQATGTTSSQPIDANFLKKFSIDNVIGNVFEGMIAATGSPFTDKETSGATFDFPSGLGPVASNFQNAGALQTLTSEAKSSATTDNLQSVIKKVKTIYEKEAAVLANSREFKELSNIKPIAVEQRERRGSGTIVGLTQRNKQFAIKTLNDIKSGNKNLQELNASKISSAGKFKEFLGGRQESPELIQEFLESVANAEIKKKGGRIGFATGGQVPVALTPGELVFEPSAVEQQGLNKLEMFNASQDPRHIPKLANGGSVSVVPGTGNTDSFFTSLPEGSFVVNKKASEFAMQNQKLKTGGRVGFNTGGYTKRLKLADGGSTRSEVEAELSRLKGALAEVTNNLRDLGLAAVKAEQDQGRPVSKEKQLSPEGKAKLAEARAPLLERQSSTRQQIKDVEKELSTFAPIPPTTVPLRGGGGNNVIDIPLPPPPPPPPPPPIPPFVDPTAKTRELQALQATGAFDKQVPDFKTTPPAPQEVIFPKDQRELDLSPSARKAIESFGGSFEFSDADVVKALEQTPTPQQSDTEALSRFVERGATREQGGFADNRALEGSASRISDLGIGQTAKIDESVRKELEQVQKREILSIVNKLKTEDASLTSTKAKVQAEQQVRAKYGILAREIDNSTKASKVLNSIRSKVSSTLQRQQGESQLGRVSRVGRGIFGGIAGGTKKAGGGLGRGLFGKAVLDEEGNKVDRKGGLLPGIGKGLTSLPFALAAGTIATGAQVAFGEKTPEAAGKGSALSAGVIGASSGASLGLAFGPIGAAIGGVVGGITGAVSGYTSAFKEVEDRIRRTEVDKALENFTKKIDELSKGDLNINNLNAALAGLANQINENNKLEQNNGGILEDRGGITGVISTFLGNTLSSAGDAIAKQLGDFNIPIPDFLKDLSLEGVTKSALNAASSLGGFAESIDEKIGSLGGFGTALTAVIPGLSAVRAAAFASRAQRSPEAQKKAEEAQNIAINEEAQRRAERNQPIVESATKAIEKALSTDRVTTQEAATQLDPTVFRSLGQASIEAQKAARKAELGIISQAEADAVLVAESKKVLGPIIQRIDNEKRLAAASAAAQKSISLAIDRFDAIARAMEIVAESGEEYRSQISLINGTLTQLESPKVSGRIDLLDRIEFKGIEDRLKNILVPGKGSNELIAGLSQTRDLKRIAPEIAADVASTAGISGITPEKAIRDALIKRGISDTSSFGKAIKDVLKPTLADTNREGGIKDLKNILEKQLLDLSNPLTEAIQKAADEVLKVQSQALNELQQNATAYSDAISAATDKLQQAAELNVNRGLQLREALGQKINVSDVFQNLVERVNIRTRRGGAGNLGARPNDIANEIRALRAQQVQLDKNRINAFNAGDDVGFKQSVDALNANTKQQQALQSALDLLADDVSALSKVESELANLQRQKDEGRSLLEEVAAAAFDPNAARELNQGILAATKLLAGRGALAPGELQVGANFLKRLGAIRGQEKEVQGFLDERFIQILGARFGQDVANQFKNLTIGREGEENALVGQFNKLSALQQDAIKAQADLLRDSAKAIERAGISIIQQMKQSINEFINKKIPQLFPDVQGNVQKTGSIQANTIQAGNIQVIRQQQGRRLFQKEGGPVQRFASGGFVTGGPYIPSRDTIPAQLQPGEFVVRRKVAMKHGGLLHGLNSGRIGFQNGGFVKKDYTTEELDYIRSQEIDQALQSRMSPEDFYKRFGSYTYTPISSVETSIGKPTLVEEAIQRRQAEPVLSRTYAFLARLISSNKENPGLLSTVKGKRNSGQATPLAEEYDGAAFAEYVNNAVNAAAANAKNTKNTTNTAVTTALRDAVKPTLPPDVKITEPAPVRPADPVKPIDLELSKNIIEEDLSRRYANNNPIRYPEGLSEQNKYLENEPIVRYPSADNLSPDAILIRHKIADAQIKEVKARFAVEEQKRNESNKAFKEQFGVEPSQINTDDILAKSYLQSLKTGIITKEIFNERMKGVDKTKLSPEVQEAVNDAPTLELPQTTTEFLAGIEKQQKASVIAGRLSELSFYANSLIDDIVAGKIDNNKAFDLLKIKANNPAFDGSSFTNDEKAQVAQEIRLRMENIRTAKEAENAPGIINNGTRRRRPVNRAANLVDGLTKSQRIRQFNANKFAEKRAAGIGAFGGRFNGINAGGRLDGINAGGRLDGINAGGGLDGFNRVPRNDKKLDVVPLFDRKEIFKRAGGKGQSQKAAALAIAKSWEQDNLGIILRSFNDATTISQIDKKFKETVGKPINPNNNRSIPVKTFGQFITRFNALPAGHVDRKDSVTGQFLRAGGSVDTVPAMLQPGEFVVNRMAAARNMDFLHRLNGGKIQGFAKGGVVGYQNGGSVGGMNIAGMPELIGPQAISSMDRLAGAFGTFTGNAEQLSSAIRSLGDFAAIATNLSRAAEGLRQVVIPDRIQIEVAPINVTATVSVAGADESVQQLKAGLEAYARQKINEAINRNINPITGETENNFLQTS